MINVKNTLFLNGVQEVAGSNPVAYVIMYFNAAQNWKMSLKSGSIDYYKDKCRNVERVKVLEVDYVQATIDKKGSLKHHKVSHHPFTLDGRGDWIQTGDLLNPIQKKGIFNNLHNYLIQCLLCRYHINQKQFINIFLSC